MNPEQLLDVIADAIDHRKPSLKKFYCLTWHDGQLKCLPSRDVHPDETCFGKFHIDDLNTGLTIKQWAVLQKLILNFLILKGLI